MRCKLAAAGEGLLSVGQAPGEGCTAMTLSEEAGCGLES